MNILIHHPGIIPPLKYGGAERVIYYLAKELNKKGHNVFCLVDKASSCDFATVIPFDKNKKIMQQIPKKIDIIHFHSTPQEFIPVPYVVTIHGNGSLNEEFDINSIFVSKDHAKRHKAKSFVYNGFDWSHYGQPRLDNKRTYFHFFGKAAWRVKNLKGAIQVILNTPKEKLKVLGGHRINFNMGFRITVSPRIYFYGMVGDKKKIELLQGSKGLLFPVLWSEPMGLAIVESLYMGCPVFGTPYGSLPELINSDIGFLSNNHEELVEAILNSDNYNRDACHEYARDNFNSKIMAEKYLEKYELVLNGHQLNEKKPKLIQSDPKFLEWI